MNSKQLDMIDHMQLPFQTVIGVDEVGRGCLAGAVYAAAVILNNKFDYSEITDSKKLSASRREKISAEIKSSCLYSIAIATVDEIDEINILQASLLAMRRAVVDLITKAHLSEGLIAVDGNQLIKDPNSELRAFKQQCFIKGDLRLKPIGAASIVAKVARDQNMKELDIEFPQYGFASHKAYASEQHRAAIQKFGPCSAHRKTFGGVKEFIGGFEKPFEL